MNKDPFIEMYNHTKKRAIFNIKNDYFNLAFGDINRLLYLEKQKNMLYKKSDKK